MGMIVAYNIPCGLINVPIEEFFQYNNSSTRSNALKSYRNITNSKKYTARVINDWNSI